MNRKLKVTELLIHYGSIGKILLKENLFSEDYVFDGTASEYYEVKNFNPQHYYVKTFYAQDTCLLIHVGRFE